MHCDCDEFDALMLNVKFDLPRIVEILFQKNGWLVDGSITNPAKGAKGDKSRGTILLDFCFGNQCYDSDIPARELDNLPNSPVMQRTGVTSDDDDKYIHQAVGDLADKCHQFIKEHCSQHQQHYGDAK